MKIILHVLIFCSLLPSFSFPYDDLWIQDPQNWNGGPGTIESASISIHPKGIYMEYGIYLTFSARDLGFGHSDTLEVQYHFNLPDDAIVIDSWLWIEDKIIRAEIMDQWTAARIYEDIVDRRKDPSILFKKSKNEYHLRIFPLAGDETRKVKITYLCPVQYHSSRITSPIPVNMLQISYNPLDEFHILTWLEGPVQNPKIAEYPDIEFVSKSDTLFRDYFQADLPSEVLNSSLNFSLDAAISSGLYLGKYENDDEGIYQMAFLPSEILDLPSSLKTVFLIDYDISKSTYIKQDIINQLHSNILLNFSEKDSFNIIVSKINTQRISETWLPADSAIIDSIFNNFNLNQIADYSNLPGILWDGVNFIKENGNRGNIVLISNSEEAADLEAANDLIDDILTLRDTIEIQVNVIDYLNKNYSWHWYGDRYFLGNEYLNLNLTRLTGGNYFRVLSSYYNQVPLSEVFSNTFQSLGGYITSFDLHTTLQDGFCYGRYSLSLNSNSVFLNKPIVQIGKYLGNFPFIVEASGIYNSEPFSKTIIISEEDVIDLDSLNEEMWAGNYIAFLESQSQSNDVVSEIIDLSVKERVLSLYSAFLCLEPSRGGQVCYDCLDESGSTEVEDTVEAKLDSISLAAYPNPFNSQVNIRVNVASIGSENTSYRIYNILGEVVKTFQLQTDQLNKDYNLVWDARNDYGATVASGIYFFVASTPQKNYTLKLLLMK